jgi:adenylate cyclase class 1
VHRFAGRDALPLALCEYLERIPRKRVRAPKVYCATADYGHLIRQRIESYLQDIAPFFLRYDRRHATHHIVGVADLYHEVFRRNGSLEYRVHSNALSLFKSLGEPSAALRQVRFDPNGAEVLPLAAVYQHNTPERVQVFVSQHATKLDIYVLDEHGDLYVERQIGQNIRTTLDHFSRFFAGLPTIQVPDVAVASLAGPTVEWFQLTHHVGHGWRARAIVPGLTQIAPYLSLRMFADLNANGQPEFTCYCEEQEFSSREHGAQMFSAVAGHILATRASREGYPVYITHLELSESYASHHGGLARRTVRLLEFKKRLEYHLTKALRMRLDG